MIMWSTIKGVAIENNNRMLYLRARVSAEGVHEIIPGIARIRLFQADSGLLLYMLSGWVRMDRGPGTDSILRHEVPKWR